MPKTAKRVTVWVTVWTHKYGTDFWVNSTEEKAVLSLVEIVEDYLGEIADVGTKKKIRGFLAKRKFNKAIDMYFEKMADCSLEFYEMSKRVIDE